MKTSNEYQDQLGKFYARTPKAVFAAIAYSFADRLDGETPTPYGIKIAIINEWRALNENGIVPQKPPCA